MGILLNRILELQPRLISQNEPVHLLLAVGFPVNFCDPGLRYVGFIRRQQDTFRNQGKQNNKK